MEVTKNPDIVDKHSKYFCVYCLLGLLQPKQLRCGHRICTSCLEQIIESHASETVQCPVKYEDNCDDSPITEIFPDRSAAKDMKNIQVYCPYKHDGCKEIILYSSLQDHLEKFHADHVLSSLEFDGQLRNDRRQCRYVYIGCKKLFQKEDDLVAHESDVASHMEVVLHNIEKLMEKNSRINSDLVRLDMEAREMESQFFTSQENVSLLDATIAKLEKIEESQQEIIATLDRIPLEEAQASSEQFALEEGTRQRLIYHDKDIAECDVALTNVSFKIDVMSTTSYSGVLVWKVTDYLERKQSASVRSITSPNFLTSRYGYKMSCRLYPNGDGPGKGTHLSIFFAILRSDYDDILQWPFSKRVTFVLVDQQNTKKDVKYSFEPDPRSLSFQKPTEASNIAFGCPLFVRHQVLENPDGTFLKNNQIFLKVVVGDVDRQVKCLEN